MSSNSAGPALGQGVGYGIVLGVGLAFALFMVRYITINEYQSTAANLAQIGLTNILKRFNNEVQTSEMFSTAGRSMKSGLVAAAVVSSWTWAATLLQSSTVCYRFGVSGPYWYASGACIQVYISIETHDQNRILTK